MAARCIGHACMMSLASKGPGAILKNLAMARAQHGPEIQYLFVYDKGARVLAALPQSARLSNPDKYLQVALAASSPLIQEFDEGESGPSPDSATAFEVVVPIMRNREKVGVLRVGISDRDVRRHIHDVVLRSLLMLGLAVGAGAVLALLVDRKLQNSTHVVE